MSNNVWALTLRVALSYGRVRPLSAGRFCQPAATRLIGYHINRSLGFSATGNRPRPHDDVRGHWIVDEHGDRQLKSQCLALADGRLQRKENPLSNPKPSVVNEAGQRIAPRQGTETASGLLSSADRLGDQKNFSDAGTTAPHRGLMQTLVTTGGSSPSLDARKAASLRRQAVFGAAVVQSSQGLAADTGDVYAITSNGASDNQDGSKTDFQRPERITPKALSAPLRDYFDAAQLQLRIGSPPSRCRRKNWSGTEVAHFQEATTTKTRTWARGAQSFRPGRFGAGGRKDGVLYVLDRAIWEKQSASFKIKVPPVS